jgi:hypothetical protein
MSYARSLESLLKVMASCLKAVPIFVYSRLKAAQHTYTCTQSFTENQTQSLTRAVDIAASFCLCVQMFM